jgi:PAS domain-containing protein
MGTAGSGDTDFEPLDESIRFVLEAAGIGWWLLDMATNTTTRSLLHDQMFGYTQMLPSWSYDDYIAHVHPDDRAMVAESFAEALAGG